MLLPRYCMARAVLYRLSTYRHAALIIKRRLDTASTGCSIRLDNLRHLLLLPAPFTAPYLYNLTLAHFTFFTFPCVSSTKTLLIFVVAIIYQCFFWKTEWNFISFHPIEHNLKLGSLEWNEMKRKMNWKIYRSFKEKEESMG